MSYILLIIIAWLVLVALFMIILIKTAPYGAEDKKGVIHLFKTKEEMLEFEKREFGKKEV